MGSESEIYSTISGDVPLPGDLRPQVIERLIDIAAELGSEGREGKPVGTLFAIGDTDCVISVSRHKGKVSAFIFAMLFAAVVGTDKATDIAVLKIKANGLHSAKLGDSSNLQVGDWALAIGSPFGLA